MFSMRELNIFIGKLRSTGFYDSFFGSAAAMLPEGGKARKYFNQTGNEKFSRHIQV